MVQSDEVELVTASRGPPTSLRQAAESLSRLQKLPGLTSNERTRRDCISSEVLRPARPGEGDKIVLSRKSEWHNVEVFLIHTKIVLTCMTNGFFALL